MAASPRNHHPPHWRPIVALLALLAISTAATSRAAPPEGRHLLRTGKYAEAIEALSPEATESSQAAVDLARAFAAQGRFDDAQQALDPWLGKSPDVDAETARLAFERGDYPRAEAHAEAALKQQPNGILALWIQAELHRTAGRQSQAAEICQRLVELHNETKLDDVEQLRWIGRAAARHAAWNSASGQFRFLTTAFYPDLLAVAPDFWPAHYDAGRLLLAKYNQGDASKQFRAALQINPHSADVHAALADLALLERDTEAAQPSIDRALEICPGHGGALRARADLLWLDSRFDEALALLETEVLPANPRSEATLGRLLAATIKRDGDQWQTEQAPSQSLLQQLLDQDASPNDAYLAAARWLEMHHHMDAAAELLTQALQTSPDEPRVAAQLAQIKMQQGYEDEAGPLFRAAFDRDPFNVRTKNMLELLDMLDDLETDHVSGCVLRYEKKRDGLLARYATEYLETEYPRLCKLFGFRPEEEPLVEILNESRGVPGAQWFGTRMVGLPYVGPVAASTGRIVVMVSPNDPSMGRKYNWAETLRHEMVHVVTLQQTGYRIPHWYTEGLAVWCEEHRRPLSWNPLLVRREAEDTLLDLSTINAGFTRPEKNEDRALAYCQAELYVEYMLQDRSEQVLRDLLDAYTDGLSTADAIRHVFGVEIDQFEAGYRQYVAQVAGAMADLKPETGLTFAELLAATRDNPDDADLAAALAYAYLNKGAAAEAFASARRAITLKPRHSRATYVLARLHVRQGRPEAAVALLKDCLDEDSPDTKVVNLLAALHLKSEQFAEAERLYRLGMHHNPNNPAWLQMLLRTYVWQGDAEKATATLAQIAELDSHDVATRKKLVQAALAGGDYESVVKWANQAIQIDVNDAELHEAFAEALSARHNRKMALREWEAAVTLQPDNTDYQLGMVGPLLDLGRIAEARAILEPLAKNAPQLPKLQPLLERLEQLEQE